MLGPFATASRRTSMSTTTTTTTTTTTRDRGDRYGPIEWAQLQQHGLVTLTRLRLRGLPLSVGLARCRFWPDASFRLVVVGLASSLR